MSQPYVTTPAPRRGLPKWAWALIVFGCGGILLVVLAFFAIGAAVLFPVFNQAREKARSVGCLARYFAVRTKQMQYLRHGVPGVSGNATKQPGDLPLRAPEPGTRSSRDS